MSTLTTINSTDLITNSRTVINTNFSTLNTDKIETSVIDTDTTLAANSDAKIASQKATKAYADSIIGTNASESVKGVVEEATDAEVTAGTATGGTGAKLFVTPPKLQTYLGTKIKFGGSGADGALSITSGTTTIDLGGVAVVTKNYTSISITGSGVLAFSNPHASGTIVILKSQGGVTLTSSATPMVAANGLGGDGGAGGVRSSASGSTAGSTGTTGTTLTLITGAGVGGSGSGGAAGAKPTAYIFSTTLTSNEIVKFKYQNLSTGAGGGGGLAQRGSGTATATGGAGGKGGGALVIECGGAFNFTTTNGISVAGENGAVGTSTGGAGDYGVGGGGGGGGGTALILYNSLTANSGTITVSGGTGANEIENYAASAAGGGGGASAINNGSAGTAAANAKTGGDGGAGQSIVISNTEFS